MKKRFACGLALGILLGGTLVGCDSIHPRSVRDTIAKQGGEDAARMADSAFDRVAIEKLYAGLRLVAHAEAGVQIGDGTQPVAETLWIEDRRPHIKRFPCSQCHAEARPAGVNGEAVAKAAGKATTKAAVTGPRDAHFGLEVAHAPASAMQCATCHGEKMGSDSLVSLTGQGIAFEKSFQLCSQCHMSQARDFMGGAHGKRLGGWTGPRVVRNCTGCHDPHAPQIAKRWPSAAATRGESK